ncbi:GNAT family N-acetyltransferase [Actinoplanes solisilvae]|uniref:GNAT family N-acetyltransferase n=1 Tax=Actinoplanes solisilvae TaxID=2486853 RepID=UPI00196B339B|nr:GNAT family N-acetyltransferase [Actinoplanes solisilvae]
MQITRLAETDERLAWLGAAPDGRPLGTAFLWLPGSEIQLHVHPAERRTGVATGLLHDIAEVATARGLRTLQTEQIAYGSEGDHFCEALGFRRVLGLTYTRLNLTDVVAPLVDEVPGYRLVHWEGTVTDDLVETFVRARSAMDDMPMGEAINVTWPWDVARLHAVAEVVANRDETLCTTAALTTDGEMAGFTELVVPASGGGDAQHYGTGVLPAHRGHGLARWMKAAQMTRVRTRFPALTGLLADAADDNTAMRHINEALGYHPTHRTTIYQRDLT